jgi:1,4-dihydroxy-2-naphthoate polyprenyltransferase
MSLKSLSIELIRPKTLIASIAPVALSAAWALHFDHFDFFKFIILLLTALSLQILANVANDYFDGIKGTDNHLRIGPKRLTSSGLVDTKTIRNLVYISFILTFIMGSILTIISSPLIGIIFGISLIFAILYTATPFAISYNGIAEPFAFLFFGPIPTFFAVYVFCHQFSLSAFLIGCLPGLYSVILITINNLRDYESDSVVSKFTLIVKKGKQFGKNLILACLIAQVLLTIIIGLFAAKFLLSLIVLPECFYFYSQIRKSQAPIEFAVLLKSCAKLYATATILWICFFMI